MRRPIERLLIELGILVPRQRVRHASGRSSYAANKESARALVRERLFRLNADYGFTYHRVLIKDQKTMWGSCSRKGNLNFNWRLIQLPPELADYVIVHELCHLKELNHSQLFWSLVAQTIPDYKERRKALRAYHLR